MRRAFGLMLTLAVAGCGPHQLDHTQPSADALAREVLNALARRDEAQLRALAISEKEFEARVWPELPASRPERNLPWSYVWLELRQKSDAMLKRTLVEHGGRQYALEQVKFGGQSTDYRNYRVHRDARLVVRDASSNPVELLVLGSMVEAEDGWKVFSYVVDE